MTLAWVKLGNAEYRTTLATIADAASSRFKRRYVLVDAAAGHPIIQRLHGDRYVAFTEIDRDAALDWARQITEAGLETCVFDRNTEARL